MISVVIFLTLLSCSYSADVLTHQDLAKKVHNSVLGAMASHFNSEMSQYSLDDHHQLATDLHMHLHRLHTELIESDQDPEWSGKSKAEKKVYCAKKPKCDKKNDKRLSVRKTLAKAAADICKETKNVQDKKISGACQKLTHVSKHGTPTALLEATTEVVENHHIAHISSKTSSLGSILRKQTRKDCRKFRGKFTFKRMKRGLHRTLQRGGNRRDVKMATKMEKYFECACGDKRMKCIKKAAKASLGFVNQLDRIMCTSMVRSKWYKRCKQMKSSAINQKLRKKQFKKMQKDFSKNIAKTKRDMKQALKMSPKQRIKYLEAHPQVMPFSVKKKLGLNKVGFLEAPSKKKNKSKKFGVSYDSRSKSFAINVGFPNVGLDCNLAWSLTAVTDISGSCTFKMINVAILIQPVAKKITLTVSFCHFVIVPFEEALKKVGFSEFLKENRILNGCIILGHASYSWKYQRFDLTVHPLCSPPLGPFKACASMQLFWRIKSGGIYEDEKVTYGNIGWRQLDLNSQRATSGCSTSTATKYRAETYTANEKTKCHITSSCVNPHGNWQSYAKWETPNDGWQTHYFKSEAICRDYADNRKASICKGKYTKYLAGGEVGRACAFRKNWKASLQKGFAEPGGLSDAIWAAMTPADKIIVWNHFVAVAKAGPQTPQSNQCQTIVPHKFMYRWGPRKPEPSNCVVHPWSFIAIKANIQFMATRAACDVKKAIFGMIEDGSTTKQKSATLFNWNSVVDAGKYILEPSWCHIWGPNQVIGEYFSLN